MFRLSGYERMFLHLGILANIKPLRGRSAAAKGLRKSARGRIKVARPFTAAVVWLLLKDDREFFFLSRCFFSVLVVLLSVKLRGKQQSDVRVTCTLTW